LAHSLAMNAPSSSPIAAQRSRGGFAQQMLELGEDLFDWLRSAEYFGSS